MNYTVDTRDRVLDFIREHKVVGLSEIVFLGKKSRQVDNVRVLAILDDLESEGKVRINKIRIGKKLYREVSYIEKRRID